MPRPLPHRLLSALLALLVLATSVGLTAERHRCRISGRSSVTLSLPGLATTGQAGTATDKPNRPCGKRRTSGCCDISHAQHKLSAQSAASLTKWLPDAPPPLAPALLPAGGWVSLSQRAAPLAAGVAVGTATNSSPPGVPRAGRVLLRLVCTLVV